MSKNWYVLQVKTGCENKVRETLTKMFTEDFKDHKDALGQILVPSENILEMRSGKKRETQRKFYPGYVLIEADLSDEVWHLIKSMPNVVKFVGGRSDKPVALTPPEVDRIMQRVQESVDKPKPKVLFEAGEIVRVIDGPFADFSGTIEEVNYDKNRLRVAVLIFGRSTPVDLDFSQVEKS